MRDKNFALKKRRYTQGRFEIDGPNFAHGDASPNYLLFRLGTTLQSKTFRCRLKSYLLFSVASADAAASALDQRLPGQRDPWLLLDRDGDVIAYFVAEPSNLDYEGPDDPNGPGPLVQADISGRHYYEDDAVISVLRDIQLVVGGMLKNDNDELV